MLCSHQVAGIGLTYSLPFMIASILCRSLLRPGHQERPPILRVDHLGLLDGAGGIHMLGTDARAFADERAFPDPLAGGNEVGALVLGAVARVEVVALSQGNFGSPLTIMPQLPHTPMRHDQR